MREGKVLFLEKDEITKTSCMNKFDLVIRDGEPQKVITNRYGKGGSISPKDESCYIIFSSGNGDYGLTSTNSINKIAFLMEGVKIIKVLDTRDKTYAEMLFEKFKEKEL